MAGTKKDKISVIVPVYNGQDGIVPCAESILTQNIRAGTEYDNSNTNANAIKDNKSADFVTEPAHQFDIEIIIINDGSTDNTAAVCQSLAAQHENIKIITLTDLGVSSARNAGLAEAAGNYITFVDADDRLLPGTLARLWELAERTGSDITGCGFARWYDEADYDKLALDANEYQRNGYRGNEYQRNGHRENEYQRNKYQGNEYQRNEHQKSEYQTDKGRTLEHQTTKEQIPKEVDGPHGGAISYTGMEFIDRGILNGDTRCWGKLYRRTAIAEIRFEEGLTIGEDMLFLLAAVRGANKITVTADQGYGYFQNPQGAMNRIFKASYMDQITCWTIAAERIEKCRPDLKDKVTGIIMTAIMLTVGKIAELPSELRNKHQDKLLFCRQRLKDIMPVPGAYGSLSGGYRIKVKVFIRFPGLYIKAYHYWKSRSRGARRA